MVKTLNITLDDDVWEKANRVKDDHDLTWPEYIEVAAEELEHARKNNSEPDQDIPEVNIDFNEDIDLPGSGDVYKRRKKIIFEMAELLRDRGTATKSDFLELVNPDDVGYSSRESFWSNCVKGRDSLRVLPGVNPPKEGMSEWTYNGPI